MEDFLKDSEEDSEKNRDGAIPPWMRDVPAEKPNQPELTPKEVELLEKGWEWDEEEGRVFVYRNKEKIFYYPKDNALYRRNGDKLVKYGEASDGNIAALTKANTPAVDVPEYKGPPSYPFAPPPSYNPPPAQKASARPFKSLPAQKQEEEPDFFQKVWNKRVKYLTIAFAVVSAIAGFATLVVGTAMLPVAYLFGVVVFIHNLITHIPPKLNRNWKSILPWLWEIAPEALTLLVISVIQAWNGDGAIMLIVTAILLGHDSRND